MPSPGRMNLIAKPFRLAVVMSLPEIPDYSSHRSWGMQKVT